MDINLKNESTNSLVCRRFKGANPVLPYIKPIGHRCFALSTADARNDMDSNFAYVEMRLVDGYLRPFVVGVFDWYGQLPAWLKEIGNQSDRDTQGEAMQCAYNKRFEKGLLVVDTGYDLLEVNDSRPFDFLLDWANEDSIMQMRGYGYVPHGLVLAAKRDLSRRRKPYTPEGIKRVLPSPYNVTASLTYLRSVKSRLKAD